MFVVDTNVLVYAANEALPEHVACRRLLDRWQKQEPAWFTTWGVLYEFLHVISHPRFLRRPWPVDQAVGFVQTLVDSPGLTVLAPTSRHAAILAQTVREVRGLGGNILHDVHTAVLMREHGIRRIVTRDSDFHQFPFVEVIDPLSPGWPDAVRERAASRSKRTRRKKLRV